MLNPTDHLTPQEREWLRLAEEATEGPWEVIDDVSDWGLCVGTPRRIILSFRGRRPKGEKTANAQHIAASRTALPALAAQLERARAILAEMPHIGADSLTWNRWNARRRAHLRAAGLLPEDATDR